VSCNCKASSHIVRTKKKFGYEMPTRKNVKISTKIKMVLQAILIWMFILLFLPVTIIILIFAKIFKREVKLFKKIKIRL
jgi:hypothetical protein